MPTHDAAAREVFAQPIVDSKNFIEMARRRAEMTRAMNGDSEPNIFDVLADALEKAELDARRYRKLRDGASGTMFHNKHYAGEIQVIQWEDRTTANVRWGHVLDLTLDNYTPRDK